MRCITREIAAAAIAPRQEQEQQLKRVETIYFYIYHLADEWDGLALDRKQLPGKSVFHDRTSDSRILFFYIRLYIL